MELELVWREKEAKFGGQRRELKLWESAIVNRERQERICSNCGHKRLQIETQRSSFQGHKKYGGLRK